MQCHAFRYTNASSWSMQTNLLLICHSDRFQRMLSSSAGNYSIATPSEHQHSSHELTTRNQPEKKSGRFVDPSCNTRYKSGRETGDAFWTLFSPCGWHQNYSGGVTRGFFWATRPTSALSCRSLQAMRSKTGNFRKGAVRLARGKEEAANDC